MGINTSELQEIIGKDRIISRKDQVNGLFARPVEAPGLVAVQPEKAEEVQKLLPWARENRISVYTKYSPYFPESIANAEGVAIDFQKMNQIERVDSRNLMVHVQRGVTFAQLQQVLEPLGLRVGMPVAGGSDSVVESLVNREVIKDAAKYPEVQVTNMKVALADGRIHLTGSHALDEEMADWKEDGGPSFSRWYLASQDFYGVVCRASVYIYPKYESRRALVFSFSDLAGLLKALKEIPVCEIGLEYLGFDARGFEQAFGAQAGAPWMLVAGFDGRKKHVEWQVKTVRKLAAERGGKAAEPLAEEKICAILDKPGNVLSERHLACFTTPGNYPALDESLLKFAQKTGGNQLDLGRILTAHDRGRAIYAVYDIFGGVSAPDFGNDAGLFLHRELGEKILFDLPQGKLAEEIYAGKPGLSRLLGHVKGLLDPAGILNPQLSLPRAIKAEEKPAPPPERKWNEILEEIKAVVGEAWLSDRLADLLSYGHDFSIVSGVIPNLVVLPKDAAEIQAVMKIAGRYQVPVVPLSTGFNHAGMALPRRGGILLDLRRMNKALINPETMVATVEPAVRLRALYMDAIKYRVAEGVVLKPALPLSFTSVSVLGNYVARGGAGCMVKYGGNPEMITNMTWILPDGEIVKLGPAEVPVQYGPGPEIAGMFFNADGQFGVCSDITIKLFPEFPAEKLLLTASSEIEDDLMLKQLIDANYALCRDNIVDFTYKLHHGVPSTILAGIAGMQADEVAEMVPPHSMPLLIQGYNQEELEIKEEIVKEIIDGNKMFFVDAASLNLQDVVNSDTFKKGYGVLGNRVAAYRGAFQWIASFVKLEKLPELWKEYKELREKYWTPPDPRVYREMILAGMAMQGPQQFARCANIEFDWWWDHGNPDSIKRASMFVREAAEFLVKRGAPLFRNMHGAGDIHLPQHKVYFDLLKDLKKMVDPAGIMHPSMHHVL
jgi:FAD/FMN-containing dehydrogenase